MGTAQKQQGKLTMAKDAYEKAISIKPAYADAYYNLGTILQEMRKLDEAIDAYSKAISINSDYAHAYNNMGNVLKAVSYTHLTLPTICSV